MPNTLQLFPQKYGVSNDPTQGLLNSHNQATIKAASQLPGPLPGLLETIKLLTGIDLSTVFAGIDLTNPGALLTAIETTLQQVIDGLITGVTGISSSGSNPASILFALLNSAAAIPGDILQLLFGQQSTTAAQVQALTNNAGTTMSDNFATVGVSGYTNLVGTLAVNNGLIQTPSEAVAYRNVGPSTDQHGVHIVIGGNMQGIFRIGICCDTAASSWCGLEIYSGFKGDCVRVVTGASPTLTVVQAQVDMTGTTGITTKLANGNTFDIWYQTSINTFHVLRNGQPVGLDWVDSTNIVTHNSSHRKILVTSNGENNSTNGFYGPGVSQIVCYDHS